MSPAEVPDALLDQALRVVLAERKKGNAFGIKRDLRHALAAVLPEIQAQAQQGLITDLLARDLWDVRYALNEYPIQAVPKSALLERRNRLARLTTTTEEPTDG